jgi:DNA polymerase-3 subunit chi
MDQIDFHFGVPNRALYACRLIKKVTGMGLSVAVWSTNRLFLRRVYDDLYRFEDLTFIAHAWAGTEYAADCRVIFSDSLPALAKSDVIVLLDDQVPPDWERSLEPFSRAVDIVSVDQNDVLPARERYRTYLRAKVNLKAHDLSRAQRR